MRLSRSSSLSPNTGCKVKIPHWIWSVLTGPISEQKGSVGRVRREVLALFKLIGEKKKKVTKSCPCGNPVNICGSSRAQHIPAEEPLCSNDWTSVPRLHTPTKWTADGSLLSKHKCIVGQNWHWHPLGSSTSREGTKTFKTDANQAFAQRSGFTLKKRRQ